LLFRIATWNINSVRLRIGLVEKFLDDARPDVLCLQETKCPNAEFPGAALRKLGYEHLALSGQKGYHGVAIVSRHPLGDVGCGPFCGRGHARHVTARVQFDRPLEIHNFYVPAGGDIADPELNDKFAHKLEFVDALRDWTASSGVAARDSILVGDLNIAPLEHDVWSHKALLVGRQPYPDRGREADGGAVRRALGGRHAPAYAPSREALYVVELSLARLGEGRQGAPPRSCLGGATLAPQFRDMTVLKQARGWDRPSDHAPIIADFDI
jgi:exodeoxyribonuclease-3